MKKIYAFIIIATVIAGAAKQSHAQSGQKFATGLNSLSGADAFGTSNLFPLIIKTNNTEWFRITETGIIDVSGNSRFRKSSLFDSSLTALKVKSQSAEFAVLLVTGSAVVDALTVINNAVINGQLSSSSLSVTGNSTLNNATINGQLTTNNVTSSTGTIDFGNNNLSTTGNVNSSNISSLSTSVTNQQTQISTLSSRVDSINASQWSTNPDSSISFSGNVFVNSLNAQNSISIGAFKFSNGAVPAPIQRDTISAPNKLVIASQTKAIELAADTITMKQYLGIGRTPTVALDVVGDIAASGAISSSSITTFQLTINGGLLESDTMHARKQMTVNNSLLLSRETANNFAEVSTLDANVALVLQKDSTGSGVGIGITPSAGEKLSVAGNVGVSGNLRLSNLSGTGDRQMLVDANGNMKAGGSSSLLCPEWNGCGNGSMNPDALIDPKFLGTTDNFPLAFRTNNIEQIRILPNGNVGIGTANPQHQLHLHSIDPPPSGDPTERTFPLDTTLNFDSLGNYVNLPIQTDPLFRTLQITNNTTGDQWGDGLLLGVSGTSGFLNLQEGNSPLHVVSHGGLSLYTTHGNAFFGSLYGAMILQSKGAMRFSVNGQLAIAIHPNGNVGIGTVSPAAKLDVNGTGKFSNNVTIGTTTANADLDVNGTINAAQYLKNGQPFANEWATAGNSADIYSNNTGNVGIGTSCPQNKLEVIGTIRSYEWIVENFPGCDFVFEDNYKRMTYQEKEKWFKEKKHLRGIAPAKETDISGMKAGETISGIIMNVEENSLDIIDLQKENETLKNKNNELEKRIEALEKKNRK